MKITLNDYLEKIDKSLYWLAKEADISYSTLHNLASNKTQSIHFATIDKVMRTLDIEDFNKIMDLA